ncbi:hypothetical protein PGT21_033728 [Puccinia graminis f. sp. tritici]|uniref:Uncharacterized protein n=1 Tax=Puccinia graminis f. sp. tritici TaxID=56615 RepID=A0A5B0MYV7_PUCGR|nr:hypothetical protein PGT21_033728 [Puccinia graminis f. sp. tritici]
MSNIELPGSIPNTPSKRKGTYNETPIKIEGSPMKPTEVKNRPAKRIMSVLGKDPDSNMQDAKPENLPFDPEDTDIKPVIPMPNTRGDSWEKIRAQLLRCSTPHMRFRAMWDRYDHNDRSKLENQKELNVMIIMIQALREGKSVVDKPDILLHSALRELRLTPKLLQQAKDHVNWPNEYIIHLSPTDALQLPSFDNRLRGVFYGTEGRKSAYVWHLMPIFKAKDNHFAARYLKFKAQSTPKTIVTTPSLINGNLTYNGDLTFFIPSIPTGEVPMRLWKNPNNNHLPGLVCGHPVKLELLPACHMCGCEDHDVAHCLYTNHLLGAPAIPEESDNEIMEISHFPEPISKKKKKANKVISEVPTVVHHSAKQRGNGLPVASTSRE